MEGDTADKRRLATAVRFCETYKLNPAIPIGIYEFPTDFSIERNEPVRSFIWEPNYILSKTGKRDLFGLLTAVFIARPASITLLRTQTVTNLSFGAESGHTLGEGLQIRSPNLQRGLDFVGRILR
jgi:hypothetical protein